MKENLGRGFFSTGLGSGTSSSLGFSSSELLESELELSESLESKNEESSFLFFSSLGDSFSSFFGDSFFSSLGDSFFGDSFFSSLGDSFSSFLGNSFLGDSFSSFGNSSSIGDSVGVGRAGTTTSSSISLMGDSVGEGSFGARTASFLGDSSITFFSTSIDSTCSTFLL